MYSEPSTASTALLKLSSSARVVDDPDSVAFYDSGLLTMPILWILFSALRISHVWTFSDISRVLSLSSVVSYAPPGGVSLSVPSWLYFFTIGYFFTSVVAVLDSMLISMRGSQAGTYHPRCRMAYKILVFAALLTAFYMPCIVMLGFHAIPTVVGIYILCSLVLVEYVSP